MHNHLVSGDWNVLCDSCGRKFKASQVMRRWDGLIVCKDDFESRHSSDFLRVPKERISVPFVRPYPAEDTFIPITYSQTFPEFFGLTEQLAKTFTKALGGTRFQSSDTLGNSPLNTLALNQGTSSVSIGTEQLFFVETLLFSLGRNLIESFAFTETLTTKLFSTVALNGSPINSKPLG